MGMEFYTTGMGVNCEYKINGRGVLSRDLFTIWLFLVVLIWSLFFAWQTSFWVVRDILNEAVAKNRAELIMQFVKITRVSWVAIATLPESELLW